MRNRIGHKTAIASIRILVGSAHNDTLQRGQMAAKTHSTVKQSSLNITFSRRQSVAILLDCESVRANP